MDHLARLYAQQTGVDLVHVAGSGAAGGIGGALHAWLGAKLVKVGENTVRLLYYVVSETASLVMVKYFNPKRLDIAHRALRLWAQASACGTR
jgi:glycerate kinase